MQTNPTSLQDCTSAEEVVTLTLAKIAQQDWKPAMTRHTGGCSYRMTDEGKTLCCAVGVHITPKLYADAWGHAEGKDIYGAIAIAIERAGEEEKDLLQALSDNAGTLRQMQHWHDDCARKLAGSEDLKEISLRNHLYRLLERLKPLDVKLRSPEYYEELARSLDK